MQNRSNTLGSALPEFIEPPSATLRQDLLVGIFFLYRKKACIEARSFLVIDVGDVEVNFRFRKIVEPKNTEKIEACRRINIFLNHPREYNSVAAEHEPTQMRTRYL